MKNNLLFITQHLPFPPYSGARRREYELLKHLTLSNKVTILAISKVFDDDERMSPLMDLDVDGIYLYHANHNISLSEANAKNVSLQSYRNSSQQAKLAIPQIIQKHAIDVIHIEGFYMKTILPDNLGIPVVLCEQNIEYDIWTQQSKLHRSTKEDYIKQAEIVKREECAVWRNVDKIVTVTENDALIISSYGISDITVVSNGYDHGSCLKVGVEPFTIKEDNSPILLYVGNYDYKPNEDAVFYFVQEILPSIRSKIKDVKVFIVGNIGNSNIERLKSESVIVTGRVDNLDDYFRCSTIFICPLRFGGGIKTKILEALYASKAIVTSSIGLQGIRNPEQSPFIIADTPADFADGVIQLLTDSKYRGIKEGACRNVLSLWMTWAEAANLLNSVYRAAVNSKQLYSF